MIVFDCLRSIGDLFQWLDSRVPSRYQRLIAHPIFHPSPPIHFIFFQAVQPCSPHARHILLARRHHNARGGRSVTPSASNYFSHRCFEHSSHFYSVSKPSIQALDAVTACAGLAPSAVLNIEFVSGRGNARSQAMGGSRPSAHSQAGGGGTESWPSWIIRIGLTVIMLPFRAVGMLFGQEQRYDPLPQTPAAATSGGGIAPAGGASRAPARVGVGIGFGLGFRV